MSRVADFIDSSPLFQILTEIVTKGPGKLIGMISNAASSLGDALPSGGSGGGLLAKVGDWVRGGDADHSPQIAHERAPSTEISAPAKSVDRFTISMADLGELAPPAVGASVARSAGMGMQA